MTDAALITPASIAANDDLTDRLRGDTDFDSRWAAWQSRGRSHDRALQHRLSVLASVAAIVGAAIASLFLIR
jgi:hypothetical protein